MNAHSRAKPSGISHSFTDLVLADLITRNSRKFSNRVKSPTFPSGGGMDTRSGLGLTHRGRALSLIATALGDLFLLAAGALLAWRFIEGFKMGVF